MHQGEIRVTSYYCYAENRALSRVDADGGRGSSNALLALWITEKWELKVKFVRRLYGGTRLHYASFTVSI